MTTPTAVELDKWSPNQVGRTQVGEFLISTVDLEGEPQGGVSKEFAEKLNNIFNVLRGIKHQRFETMIFKGTDSHELFLARYDTLEEAQAGHKRAVVMALEGVVNVKAIA